MDAFWLFFFGTELLNGFRKSRSAFHAHELQMWLHCMNLTLDAGEIARIKRCADRCKLWWHAIDKHLDVFLQQRFVAAGNIVESCQIGCWWSARWLQIGRAS